MSKITTELDEFDFGFTAATSEEINAPVVQHVTTKVLTETERKYETIIDNLLKAVDPLLNNLAKDSDSKTYIHWPNRAAKIEEFRVRLRKIAGRS